MAKKIKYPDELEEKLKSAKEKTKARNQACALIDDARVRYIKSKTRAASKAAALERDAYLQSAHFKPLEMYDRRRDIQEDFGWGAITEKQRDELEELWDEREEVKNHTDKDGFYKDLVTMALYEAYIHIADLWEEDISEAEQEKKDIDREQEEHEAKAAEWMRQQNEAYERMVKGDG